MREYMAWKEAHSKRGTKNEVERGAALHLEGLEEDTDSDFGVEDGDDDDGGGDEVAGKPAAGTPKSENGDGNSAEHGEAATGAKLRGGDGDGGAAALDEAGGKEVGKGNGEKNPWQTKMKPQQQQQQRSESVGGEAREWAAEEEEVASRMEHRKVPTYTIVLEG